MLHIKFQDRRSSGSGEKILKALTIMAMAAILVM